MISGCQCTLALSLPVLPCSVGSSPAFFAPSFHLSAPPPHSAAPREARVSPPPPSPSTSCSSAFVLPTTIFCCYGNREAVLEGGGVLEQSHCWPWSGRELVGGRDGGRKRGERRELRIRTQPAPDGERDFSTPSMRGRQGRGRAAQCQAGSAAASFRWLNRRRLSGRPLW